MESKEKMIADLERTIRTPVTARDFTNMVAFAHALRRAAATGATEPQLDSAATLEALDQQIAALDALRDAITLACIAKENQRAGLIAERTLKMLKSEA